MIWDLRFCSSELSRNISSSNSRVSKAGIPFSIDMSDLMASIGNCIFIVPVVFAKILNSMHFLNITMKFHSTYNHSQNITSLFGRIDISKSTYKKFVLLNRINKFSQGIIVTEG